MEYTVYDLVRILLKKWYVILLAMVLTTGAAIYLSQASFEQVSEQYETYTASEAEESEESVRIFGTLVTSYDCRCLLPEGREKSDVLSHLKQLLTDPLVILIAQEEMGDARAHFSALSAALLGEETLRITVSGLEEAEAQKLLPSYLAALKRVGASSYSLEFQLEEKETLFFPQPSSGEESPSAESFSSQFAQMIMQPPTKPPAIVRTAGTAAAYAFVLACFGILVYTFIKDTCPAKKEQEL